MNTMVNKMYMKAEMILKYLIGNDNEVDTMISCGANTELVTTDHALYEALGSVKDDFNWRRLVKFLEVVQVISYKNVHKREKPILTEKRVEELRKALEADNTQKSKISGVSKTWRF